MRLFVDIGLLYQLSPAQFEFYFYKCLMTLGFFYRKLVFVNLTQNGCCLIKPISDLNLLAG